MPTVIDTNTFIDHENILAEYEEIVLSIVVLKELDSLKFKSEIGYSARTAIRNIRKYLEKYKDKVVFDTNQDPQLSADLNIIMCAKRNNALLVTKDISMSLLAESFNVKCELKQDNLFSDYSPYIYDPKPEFPFESNDLQDDQLKDFKIYIKEKFNRELSPWNFYTTKKDIFCYNPKKKMLECVSKNKSYCELFIDEGVKFKPKDKFQKAAVYSILNADATLITGTFGTGKSLTSVAAALSIVNDRKIFVLRPTITSKRYDVGFMPGSKEEKLYPFYSGFMSALGYLYGNTRTTSTGKEGVSYDYIKEDLSQEKFEFLSMPELHGLSVQEGDIIICDEVQLLDIEYLGLLLSRIGEGAKLVLMGDLGQTVNLIKNSESGLNKLMTLLPHESISVVNLKEIYRNKKLCELADKLMK